VAIADAKEPSRKDISMDKYKNLCVWVCQGTKVLLLKCIVAHFYTHHTTRHNLDLMLFRHQCVQRDWNGWRVREPPFDWLQFFEKVRRGVLFTLFTRNAFDWNLARTGTWMKAGDPSHRTCLMSLRKPPPALPHSLTDWLLGGLGLFLLISLFNSLTHGCSNMGIERNCQPITVMKGSGVEAFRPLEKWSVDFYPCDLLFVFFLLALIVSALLFVLGEYLFCSLDWLKGAVWSPTSTVGEWSRGTRQPKANVWFSLAKLLQFAAASTGEITKWLRSGFWCATWFSEGFMRAYKSQPFYLLLLRIKFSLQQPWVRARLALNKTQFDTSLLFAT
jgi:hypothetical protein